MKMNWFEFLLMKVDLGRRSYLKGIVKNLHELSHFQDGKKILEIGCGNGVGSQYILEYFKPTALISTDLDERLVEISKIRNKGAITVFEIGDATNFRFSDSEFDAVIGLSVIHHIPNWKESIDEIKRIIKPGGMLIIKELSIETFESPFGRIARKIVDHPYDFMFRENEFLEYLGEKGFKIQEHQSHSMPMFLEDFLLIAKLSK